MYTVSRDSGPSLYTVSRYSGHSINTLSRYSGPSIYTNNANFAYIVYVGGMYTVFL